MSESKGLALWAKAQELFLDYHYEGIKKSEAEILHYVNSAIDSALPPDEEAMAHYIRGEIYMEQGKNAEAEVEFGKVIKSERQSAKYRMTDHFFGLTWENLAALCMNRGDREQAIKYLEEGIRELQPDYDKKEPLVYDTLARLYHRLGLKYEGYDNAKAHSLHQRALQINPEASYIHLRLAYFYANKCGVPIPEFFEPRKAIEHCERFLTLEKDDENMRQRAQTLLAALREYVKAKGEKPEVKSEKSFLKRLFG